MQFKLATLAVLANALLSTCTPITAAAPVSRALGKPHFKRSAEPIPASCPVYDSDTCSGSECPDGGDTYQPSNYVIDNYLLYTYVIDQTSPAVTDYSDDQLFEQCLEECYGYGDACVAAYNTFNVEAAETAPDYAYICQLFSAQLGPDDFDPIYDGTHTHSRYGNLGC